MRVDQDVPWPACIGNLSRETTIAFARAGRASDETTIAFADEKWAYLARISVALVLSVSMSVVQGRALVMVVSRWSASAVVEVMAVSMVAVWGRALVMVVSCWSASVAAEVSLVSTSPRHSCLCAKKFALRTKNGPKLAVYGVPGESCRTTTQVRPLLGGRHLRSNREPTCWDHHERMGMKKALPKDCLVEMQNPHRWIAPRGAAARPEGLEPPTF
ncbi:hypothetical protein O3645_06795 [Pauljensenia sp. 27098_8_107]